MTGTLFLIPNTLGPTEAVAGALDHVIPVHVQATTARLDYFVAENAKTEPKARTMALDPKTHQVYLVTAKFGPAPAPTADQPHPRPPVLPDSFVVLVMGK